MEFFEVVETRRSVRKFKPDLVPREFLRKLLEAGRLAPSGSNIQPWRFVVIDDPAVLDMVRKVSPGYYGVTPLAILLCSDREKAYKVGGRAARDYLSIVDCAMAAGYMLLAAQALGLGGCCVRSFSAPAVKEILDIPEGVEPELILALGYPEERPSRPPKLPLEEITYHNLYGKQWRSD